MRLFQKCRSITGKSADANETGEVAHDQGNKFPKTAVKWLILW